MPKLYTLPLDDLLRLYASARKWQKEIDNQNHVSLCYALGETNIDAVRNRFASDLFELWNAMLTKIPDSHILQIEEMKNELTIASKDSKLLIQNCQRWQHKHLAGLIIEIIERDKDNYKWHASQFINNKFLFMCDLSSMTIIKYFNLLKP